jgi:hypothetical protein
MALFSEVFMSNNIPGRAVWSGNSFLGLYEASGILQRPGYLNNHNHAEYHEQQRPDH